MPQPGHLAHVLGAVVAQQARDHERLAAPQVDVRARAPRAEGGKAAARVPLVDLAHLDGDGRGDVARRIRDGLHEQADAVLLVDDVLRTEAGGHHHRHLAAGEELGLAAAAADQARGGELARETVGLEQAQHARGEQVPAGEGLGALVGEAPRRGEARIRRGPEHGVGAEVGEHAEARAAEGALVDPAPAHADLAQDLGADLDHPRVELDHGLEGEARRAHLAHHRPLVLAHQGLDALVVLVPQGLALDDDLAADHARLDALDAGDARAHLLEHGGGSGGRDLHQVGGALAASRPYAQVRQARLARDQEHLARVLQHLDVEHLAVADGHALDARRAQQAGLPDRDRDAAPVARRLRPGRGGVARGCRRRGREERQQHRRGQGLPVPRHLSRSPRG